MLLTREMLKQRYSNLLHKINRGDLLTRSELAKSIGSADLRTISETYDFQKALYLHCSEQRGSLSSYERLLRQGDRAYKAYTNGNAEQSSYESYYERAQEALSEARSSNPQVDDALIISSEVTSGGVYGTSLTPDNMPRFKYSNSKYLDGVRSKRLTFNEVARDFLEEKLAKFDY